MLLNERAATPETAASTGIWLLRNTAKH